MKINKIYRSELKAINWIANNPWIVYFAITVEIITAIYKLIF